MRFGVGLPAVNPIGAPRWDNETVLKGIVAVARKADELGYEYVTCQDHVVIPKEKSRLIGPRWYDPIATLGFVAAITRRVRLLTSVVVLPYRNPFVMAKSIATLDVLSRGRVICGVGVGHLQAEFEALNVPYEQRGPMSDEIIKIMKELWAKPAASYQGKYYQFTDVVLSPKPVQRPHPPIWIGGNSRLAMRRAVLAADGWEPFQVTPEEYADRVGYGRQVAREAGRGTGIDLVAPLGAIEVVEGAARPQAQANVERRVRDIAGDSEFYRRIAGNTFAAPTRATVEGVSAKVQRFKELGVNYINVAFKYREPSHYLESMDWFAREIMPRFP